MGLAFSSLTKLFDFTKQDIRILMLGLDNAGKTTILYRLKLGVEISPIPTHGANIETVEYKNLRCTIMELCGGPPLRQLWHHYFKNTGAVIFVVDSNDGERLQEAAERLHETMKHNDLENTILLVLANKQDLPNAISVNQITKELRLNELNQPWLIQGVIGTKGQGLWEAMDKLRDMLEKHNK